MYYYVGLTDWNWFSYLRSNQADEVNFWRPRAPHSLQRMKPGTPFLFRLKSPRNVIAGGGFFGSEVRLSLQQAWSTFGTANGAPDFAAFEAKMRRARDEHPPRPDFGCVALVEPFFFEERDWIEPPKDWERSNSPGKYYGLGEDDPIGHELWEAVVRRLQRRSEEDRPRLLLDADDRPVLGPKYLRAARPGQGTFRLLTLDNYGEKCCITGETTKPVLQAAHIKPVAKQGNNALSNGLLMRSDMHILYDEGLIGVDAEHRIHVSPKIRDRYYNGKAYYAHQGEKLRSIPSAPELRPDPELLTWHMDVIFDRV